MSYVINFVNLALREAEAQHAEKVTAITVEVGETSGVLPEYLQKYYPEAVRGTIMEGSRLVTEPIPVEAVCSDCGTHYHPDRSNGYACPSCKSIRAKITGGRGVTLKAVEIEQ